MTAGGGTMDEGSDFDLDWDERFGGLSEDWEVIERVLPDGWKQAARLSGALRRTRGFKDAASLLRVMLIHLVDGCSLRETAVRARAGGLADVSDVALLGRLRGCGEWFRWMVEQMMLTPVQIRPYLLARWRFFVEWVEMAKCRWPREGPSGGSCGQPAMAVQNGASGSKSGGAPLATSCSRQACCT